MTTAELDSEICYRALKTRDARFDGRFFVAVRTTGVYCRPICPAPTPKLENCRFLPHAAAAQEAGFRPCWRCRPEASPGTPAWQGTSATVSRALRLIAEGALDEDGIPRLAARLGVGERHLRRLFLRHLGAPPLAVARTRRVHFAKKLIDETRLPITEIAFASGFASIRRFNAAIQAAYRASPRALRGGHARNGASATDITVKLAFRPPYDWSQISGFLARRAISGVEAVDPGCYRRAVRFDRGHGIVEVRPAPDRHHLLARIRSSTPNPPLHGAAERLRRLFDLGADPAMIAAHLGADPRLGPSVAARPGLRVPGAWDPFELAVRAILGQQVTIAAAVKLAERLTATYGEPLDCEDNAALGLTHLFPLPEALVEADPARLGMPAARVAAIAALARAVVAGDLRLDAARDLAATIAVLEALPGVGPWTAQYIAMRGLSEPDAFPSGDLGLRRALAHGATPALPSAVAARAEAWRPWRAYAALYLWTEGE